jgi:hypothetical protein
MTNNKIRTKILELKSPSKVKESGVISNEVSDNSGVTTSKVIDRLGRTINTKQY